MLPLHDHGACSAGASFPSPTSDRANSLIRGNFDHGSFGVLLRGEDKSKKFLDKMKKLGKRTPVGFVPASLLHVKMRAPNTIYDYDLNIDTRQGLEPTEYYLPAVGFVIGTKGAVSLPEEERRNLDVVNCTGFYPIDSRSVMRSFEGNVGTSCYPRQSQLCVNNTCMTKARENFCACDFESVPGKMYAEHSLAADQMKANAKKRRCSPWPNCEACWYPGTKKGLSEMIDASNAIYLNRKDVFYGDFAGYSQDYAYRGWTECSASRNANDVRMIDAIVVKLPPREHENVSFCTLSSEGIDVLQEYLSALHSEGYGSLPVIVMKETKGMSVEDCDEFWEGIYCQDGYHKEFFSQTFSFSDSSCIGKPPGKNEAFFYPANAAENPCRTFHEGSHSRDNGQCKMIFLAAALCSIATFVFIGKSQNCIRVSQKGQLKTY